MLLRRLPDPVPPARHEIPVSYIRRLANLHGLDVSDLWVQVTEREKSGGMRRAVVPERLAALTGRSVHALAGAMPELRDPQPDWRMFRHTPRPAATAATPGTPEEWYSAYCPTTATSACATAPGSALLTWTGPRPT